MSASQSLPERPNYAAWLVPPRESAKPSDLLAWAVLAPSSHNTQPWAFSLDDDTILVSPDPARGLRFSDPTGRQMYLSLGAAVANLEVAARHFGLSVQAETVEGRPMGFASTLLRFAPGYVPGAEDHRLFDAIPVRASNRNPHQPREIPDELRASIRHWGEREALEISLVEDHASKAQIGGLLEQADLKILADPGFTGELSAWMRPNSTDAYDGMPGFTFGMPDLLARMFPVLVRSGQLGDRVAQQDRALIAEQTATVVVISSQQDDPIAWMQVGELFERLSLRATSLGLGIHVLAALVETEPFPALLAALLGTKARPQMMFRIGYPLAAAGHAPRRPASHVVTIGPLGARRVIPPDRPTIFQLSEQYSLAKLVAELGEVRIVDRYGDDWLSELFTIRHPQLDLASPDTQQALAAYVQEADTPEQGVWTYFPWRRTLAHIPARDDFLELLYSRNFPCIDRETQRRLASLEIGIAGLSVGSNIARALAMAGVLHLRVADFDLIAPSNNNRIGAGSVLDVGQPKIATLAHQLYEFNPYLDLRKHPEGLSSSNLAEFMHGLDVFVDHLDDLGLKVSARERARAEGVIVLMATDLAFSPIFDLELPEHAEFFGGRLARDGIEAMRQRPTRLAEWAHLAVQVCGGPENTPAAVLENFVNVARGEQNFASQLGLTGYAAAAQLAYFVYEIARGNARHLLPFKRLHLEQPDLFKPEQLQAAVARFNDEFT